MVSSGWFTDVSSLSIVVSGTVLWLLIVVLWLMVVVLWLMVVVLWLMIVVLWLIVCVLGPTDVPSSSAVAPARMYVLDL